MAVFNSLTQLEQEPDDITEEVRYGKRPDHHLPLEAGSDRNNYTRYDELPPGYTSWAEYRNARSLAHGFPAEYRDREPSDRRIQIEKGKGVIGHPNYTPEMPTRRSQRDWNTLRGGPDLDTSGVREEAGDTVESVLMKAWRESPTPETRDKILSVLRQMPTVRPPWQRVPRAIKGY